MKALKYAILYPAALALFLTVFLPSQASAALWTTPSGVVVDDNGIIVSMPVIHTQIQNTKPVIKQVLKPTKSSCLKAQNGSVLKQAICKL